MTRIDSSTPVILLGGSASSVTVARNLGQLGVPIIASGPIGCRSMNSKYCKKALPVPAGKSLHDHWAELFLSGGNAELHGSILLAACDQSLEFMETHREELSARYILENAVSELRLAMLDKAATLVLAKQVGVPIPNYWAISTEQDVLDIRDKVTFPVMVKPLNSVAFMKEFGRKLFIILDDFEEVIEKVALCRSRGQHVMVVEMIPGPDNLLTSYYTYRTPEGKSLYDYTKSVIRRWPVNRGHTCFHQSEWLPETAAMGRKLFEGIGWQGFGNIEFKRDLRDGQLKIIEVNGRFTAGHRLVTAAGAPIDVMIYCYLTGQPGPVFDSYSQSLRMWSPIHDFLAFRQMNRLGQLDFKAWVKSIFAQKLILPYFSWDDPGPTFAEFGSKIWAILSNPGGIFRQARQSA